VEEKENKMTRKIYSREREREKELSGTIQFSWIIERGIRLCSTLLEVC